MFDQIKGNKMFDKISHNKLFDQIQGNKMITDEKIAHNINVYAPNVSISLDERTDDDVSNFYEGL